MKILMIFWSPATLSLIYVHYLVSLQKIFSVKPKQMNLIRYLLCLQRKHASQNILSCLLSELCLTLCYILTSEQDLVWDWKAFGDTIKTLEKLFGILDLYHHLILNVHHHLNDGLSYYSTNTNQQLVKRTIAQKI